MKRILTLLTGACIATSAMYPALKGDWVLHPTYDSNTWKIIDTPSRTYTLGHAQPYVPKELQYADPQSFLFYYDKEGDELRSQTSRTGLSDNIVAAAEYNRDKRYLLVVYDNSNIDLVYDSGEVRNIPGLMSASMPASKRVNDITFSPADNEAWLATDFGYLCINDDKAEIAESRNYSTVIESVAHVGDDLLLTRGGKLFEAPRRAANFNLDDFSECGAFVSPARVRPLDGGRMGIYSKMTDQHHFQLLTRGAEGRYEGKTLAMSYTDYLVPNRDGYLMAGSGDLQQIYLDGTRKTLTRDEGDKRNRAGTWDFSEFWFMQEREGLYSRRYTADNKSWVTTRGCIEPNAPAVYISEAMAWHPERGMLVSNHGTSLNFTIGSVKVPMLLSGLRRGEWTRYAPAYTNPEQADVVWLPNGMAIDPDDRNMVYFGSLRFGMVRINLADPDDILHMSYPDDPSAGLPGFVEVVPTHKVGGNYNFSSLDFDADGNLWATYYNSLGEPNYEIWCWTPEDRRASKDPSTFRPWHRWALSQKGGRYAVVNALTAGSNRGMLVTAANDYGGPLLLIDTKGTPGDHSDDTVVEMSTMVDQDGSTVDHHYFTTIYEDPSTGMVWVGTDTGLFTIHPRTAMSSPTRVNRVKVSRNDGTDLADYLLNGVGVNAICSDPQGRKWFATHGAGVVCTSSDGRTIIGELTTENSWLPSDIVTAVAWDHSTGSLMISTLKGLAQYYPSGQGGGSDMDSVRAYPNPVRPDYFGYVTVDGLADNALVKIADSAGSVVKELGLAEGGVARWDVTNHNGERVRSGVYYVLASAGSSESSLSAVTKVLVIN